jgi:hypothetical protein
MNSTESLLERWRNEGIDLNPPASPVELAQLAEFLGAPVPTDLLDFYSIANGMVDNTMDRWNVSFWSIARLVRESDVVDRSGQRWIAFADFLVYSWCFRLAPHSMHTRVFAERSGEEFASLAAFFARYAEQPEALGLEAG